MPERIFMLAKHTNSKTQPLFPENTASSRFAFEGLQILILGYGWIANPPELGCYCVSLDFAPHHRGENPTPPQDQTRLG